MADQYERQLNKAEEKQQQEAGPAAKNSNAGIGRSRKANSGKPKKPEKRGDAADGSAGNEAENNAELNERMKAKLCTAVNVALGDECIKIVAGLMKRTIAGDARCATLLFALAEPSDKNASAAKKRRVMALVEELANEQEWSSEMSEAAEVMFEGGPGTRTVVVPVVATAA